MRHAVGVGGGTLVHEGACAAFTAGPDGDAEHDEEGGNVGDDHGAADAFWTDELEPVSMFAAITAVDGYELTRSGSEMTWKMVNPVRSRVTMWAL